MKKLKQLGLLIWKNFMLQRRRPVGTLVQIGLPFFMSLIYLVLRLFLIEATHYGAISWTEFNISTPPPTLKRSFSIGYAIPNGSVLSKDFLNNLSYFLNENRYPDQKIHLQNFSSEGVMVNEILQSSGHVASNCIGGIYFSTLPSNKDGVYNYKLRFILPTDDKNPLAKNGHGWLTKYVFPKFQLPQPRNKDSATGDKPSYYLAGFLFTQYAVDRAIISQFGHEPATVLMQKFPFPDYIKDAFIIIIQQFMPNFFVIAFIYTALVIVRSIVYEKEKRLKETLKIIGVDNWLHWVAWFIQSFIICLICITIMTIMFTVRFNSHGKVINQSSPSVFFVFLLLYITSGIMFCFFLSVFFSKASTAAAGGGIIWYVTFIPFFFISQNYDQMSLSLKTVTCLIPNLGMSLGSIVIGKFEGTGIGVQWDNLWKGASVDDDFSLGTVFLMMIISSILYGILTWYVENVFPGEFGTPKRWYFPFTKNYWCGSFEKVSPDDETLPLLHNQKERSEKFEKDPEGLDVGIDIRNLVKIYSGETGKKVAVDDVSLKMYEGQITVLLGHNGAGKTSLMSVLTGFYSPSGGTAIVNGYDIRTSMDGVRSSLGLCPQHDVLYDTLTVREHLWFFGRLKGLTRQEVGGEIEKMLESIKLTEKSNAQSRYLSGGMKRKLSLGLALIGKAKVLMLDEPTSGMDPSARRFTWNLLQKYRGGRTILLTTHFMDEADVLGDRIAIMAEGKVQCCGSSLFLKNHYGVGYHIVMVKEPDCKVQRITELVKQFVPNSKLESNAGAELSYVLPRESSKSFSSLFAQLEQQHQNLGIASYGASMTTMEEVFMKVGIDCDETLDDQLKATYNSTDQTINASISTIDAVETPSIFNNHLKALAKSEKLKLNTGLTLHLQRWIAMFKKRYLHSRRHKIAIVSQLLMPLIFTLLALVAAKIIPQPEDSPPRVLTTAMFDSNKAPYATPANPASSISALANMYRYSTSPNTQPIDINRKKGYTRGNMTAYIVDQASGKNLGYFNRHYFVAATFEGQDDNVTAKSWFNDQAYHAVAVALNAVDNAILKNVTGNSSRSITVTNHPLPRTLKQKSDDLDNNGVGLNVAFNLLFGMAFLASSFVVFIVQERANGAKHVQFVSGVDPFSYWTASWMWDLINFTLPCICIIVLFACFDVPAYTGGNRLGVVFLVLILYGFAIIPFMYLFSFLFKMASKAYIRLTLLNIVSGLVALLVVHILEVLSYTDTSNALNWVFFLLPNFSLGQTFSNIFTNYNRIRLYDDFVAECQKMASADVCIQVLNVDFQRDYLAWATPGVGRFLLILPLEGILFMLLVLFIDYNITRRLKCCSQKVDDPFDSLHQEVAEDSDVSAEKRRVLNGEASKDVLVVKDLKKVFKVPGRPKFAAVDHLSLGVPVGECFGLLGVNGAGKTTTFKMLTGDEVPTSGTASVDSFDIQTDLNSVRQRTGYCPQFDALIDLMTGREMLQMYATLRGVPRSEIDPLVEDLMQSVLLTEHADKLTKTYSGGNKRKLSAAIALVGDPLVVFLDEPTTGMDPVARRLLWNTLCRVRAEGRCLVITSHSMEECEALCTRLAIMVNGKFRCLGSPQHLKNKFVQGFTLLVNVPEDTQVHDTASLKHFVASTFPQSVLRDEHNGLLNYNVAGSGNSWSVLFAILEDAHGRGVIGNYAVTQTTLEQIFLNFARSQRGYDD